MNVDNIKKIIDWIDRDKAVHFRIGSFTEFLDERSVPADAKDIHNNPLKYVECNTAFCLCGYANFLRMEEEGLKPKTSNDLTRQVADQGLAAEWLGLNMYEATKLFLLAGASVSREKFDTLPDDVRAKSATVVLKNLIETGEVNWAKALREAGAI